MKSKLKNAREKAGLTQKQVAEAVGIAEAQYQRYEYGTTPLAPVACKIAKVLGVTVEYLYGED